MMVSDLFVIGCFLATFCSAANDADLLQLVDDAKAMLFAKYKREAIDVGEKRIFPLYHDSKICSVPINFDPKTPSEAKLLLDWLEKVRFVPEMEFRTALIKNSLLKRQNEELKFYGIRELDFLELGVFELPLFKLFDWNATVYEKKTILVLEVIISNQGLSLKLRNNLRRKLTKTDSSNSFSLKDLLDEEEGFFDSEIRKHKKKEERKDEKRVYDDAVPVSRITDSNVGGKVSVIDSAVIFSDLLRIFNEQTGRNVKVISWKKYRIEGIDDSIFSSGRYITRESQPKLRQLISEGGLKFVPRDEEDVMRIRSRNYKLISDVSERIVFIKELLSNDTSSDESTRDYLLNHLQRFEEGTIAHFRFKSGLERILKLLNSVRRKRCC